MLQLKLVAYVTAMDTFSVLSKSVKFSAAWIRSFRNKCEAMPAISGLTRLQISKGANPLIFHTSFAVFHPSHVAAVLAEITGAIAIKAPMPPFPAGSWFLCFENEFGTFVEILPANVAFHPDAPFGLQNHKPRLQASASHVLLSSTMSSAQVQQIAVREGWRFQEVETGLFKVAKIWIDEVVLVEFLCNGEVERYMSILGKEALPLLDKKLRLMEKAISQTLAAKPG